MIKSGSFKAADLIKLPTPSLDQVLTHLLSHIIRCYGDRRKLGLIREALNEINIYIDSVTIEDSNQVN